MKVLIKIQVFISFILDVAFNGILREKACVGVQNAEDLAIHLNKDTHALEKSLKEMINELTDHRVIKPYENLPVEKKFQIDCAAIAKVRAAILTVF